MNKLKLPEYVEICPFCLGEGQYIQIYTGGCGMGSYRSMGRCDMCKCNQSSFYKSLGYRMKNGTDVTSSIINQINEMNK